MKSKRSRLCLFAMPPSSSQKGFSLIELIIVVAIVGSMMALGAFVLFSGDEERLHDEVVRLSAGIKYVYNRAAIENQYYRIAFDLDHSSYQIELSKRPVFDEQNAEGDKGLGKKDKVKDEDLNSNELENNDKDKADLPSFIQKSHVLSEGIKIKDIFVPHEKTLRSQGVVYGYFFPNGWVEPMLINLSDEEEKYFYSLEVNPLTGVAKVREEYFEMDTEK